MRQAEDLRISARLRVGARALLAPSGGASKLKGTMVTRATSRVYPVSFSPAGPFDEEPESEGPKDAGESLSARDDGTAIAGRRSNQRAVLAMRGENKAPFPNRPIKTPWASRNVHRSVATLAVSAPAMIIRAPRSAGVATAHAVRICR